MSNGSSTVKGVTHLSVKLHPYALLCAYTIVTPLCALHNLAYYCVPNK